MKRWLLPSQLARDKSRAGYTIIEVMIVLAVSALMFVSVALLLRGRQADAQFTQAIRDLESRVQKAVNDVRNGYYNASFACTISGSGLPQPSGGANTPGANKGCVFMGKIMALTADGSRHDIRLITMMGRQYSSGTKLATSLAEARSVPAQQTIDALETFAESYGMEVSRITNISSGATIGSFAFMTDLSGATAGEATPVTLYQIANTGTAPVTSANIANYLNGGGAYSTPANFQPVTGGIRICVRGSYGRNGEVTIGASGDQTSTNVIIGSENCPA